jgi:hypothetical protein
MELWAKWRGQSPELENSELWAKYKHEWVEAYRPFVKSVKSVLWLRPF